MNYHQLYNDINESGAAIGAPYGSNPGSADIAGTGPETPAKAYRVKIPKGGKKYKKPAKPFLKKGDPSLPRDIEFYSPAGG